ncbi:hypothetical protein [Luteipulveratus flavus]|uniref:Uncharacterized protein n=1 Tax=Luteipulveratus flavus TaxID=3031728 RepID=A0ABT6C753_9MICO|nr:hypothetical protein [Luteipulveratus sp. YIM 133296]MDF8264531.1 hypothetical protein [Luteipulveratus sp. YIM 133296]
MTYATLASRRTTLPLPCRWEYTDALVLNVDRPEHLLEACRRRGAGVPLASTRRAADRLVSRVGDWRLLRQVGAALLAALAIPVGGRFGWLAALGILAAVVLLAVVCSRRVAAVHAEIDRAGVPAF